MNILAYFLLWFLGAGALFFSLAAARIVLEWMDEVKGNKAS